MSAHLPSLPANPRPQAGRSASQARNEATHDISMSMANSLSAAGTFRISGASRAVTRCAVTNDTETFTVALLAFDGVAARVAGGAK